MHGVLWDFLFLYSIMFPYLSGVVLEAIATELLGLDDVLEFCGRGGVTGQLSVSPNHGQGETGEDRFIGYVLIIGGK